MIAPWQRADFTVPRFAAIAVTFFVLYVGTVELGGLLHLEGAGFGISLWPAAGIGLAAIALYGFDLWPVIGLAALFLCLLNGIPLPYTAGIVVGAVIQAVIGAYILQRFKFDPLLARVGDTLLLFAVAFTTGLIAPLINTELLELSGVLRPEQFLIFFGIHWLGNVLSISVLASAIIRWHRKPFPRTLRELAESGAAFITLVGISLLIFIEPYQTHTLVPVFYLLLLPLLWISLRIGPRGMTLALLITSVIALAGVALPGPVSAAALINTETLLIAISLLFLIFVSSEEGRKNAIISLRSYVDRLEVALQRIRSEDRTKNEFIAVLAHELRNPLAAIRTSVEIIGMETEGNGNVQPLIAAVEERVQTTARLLDDLLDISRISQRKLELRTEAVEVRDIIDRSLIAVGPQIRSRGHTIITSVADSCRVVADPMRLEQIVVNLLTNAAKYTSVGGTITITSRCERGRASISVRDTGIGIPPNMVDRIFEPFVQLSKSTYNSSGLGIGLALTKQLVEMHGGTIKAESEGRDRGSEFTVTLPAAPERTFPVNLVPQYLKKSVVTESSLPPQVDEDDKHGTRVLVVDDNQLAAQGLCKLLQMRGYVAEPAYTGEQAIMKTQKWDPRIIILDIGLPGMNGYQVARSLRDEYGYAGTIIALTGYGQEKDRLKSANAGFDRHLVKPVGLTEIETVFNEVLNKSAV